jgi:hypothetical protein
VESDQSSVQAAISEMAFGNGAHRPKGQIPPEIKDLNQLI